jgi:hypothetical protein
MRNSLSLCIASIEKINHSLDLLGYQEKKFLIDILELKENQSNGLESKNTFKDMSLMIQKEKYLSKNFR